MIAALQSLATGRTLNSAESELLMTSILSGHAQPAQVGALLASLHYQPPTGAMLAGFVRAFRSVAGVTSLRFPDAIDVCGTGGDGLSTFNVSTAVAFVVAAAGQAVAKHGNRAVSSRCGSFDVLEALGVPFAYSAEDARKSLSRHRLAFMYAPSFHPAMRELAPVRKLLGFRTVFNVLGPMLNPASVERQLIGVYSESLVIPVAEALGELGAKHVMVVHGLDGSDEMSLQAPTRIALLREGRVTMSTFDPVTLGLHKGNATDLLGSDALGNAQIIREVLSQDANLELKAELGPALESHQNAQPNFQQEAQQQSRRNMVALNAAAAFVVCDRAETLADGLTLARQTLSSGSAAELLGQMSGVSS